MKLATTVQQDVDNPRISASGQTRMPPKKDPSPLQLAPLSVARILWKRKILILSILVLGLTLTAAVVYNLPAIYKSEALILVDSQKIPEKYVSATVNTDVGDRLATINQQIMSTNRLLKIITTFDLYKEERKKKVQEEIVEQMRTKHISLKIEKGWTGGRPGAFRVGYQGKNPAVTAEVANQLANLYIDENLKTRENQAEGTAEFVDSQLEQAKKTLDEQELKMSNFKQQHNGALPQQENSLLSTVASMQVQLQGYQDAINRAQQNKMMIETALSAAEASESVLQRSLQMAQARSNPNVAPVLSLTTQMPADPQAPPERRRSEILEQQIEQLKSRYTDDHPSMKFLQQELERTRRAEQTEAARIVKSALEAKKADTLKQVPKTDAQKLESRSTPPTPPAPVTEESGKPAQPAITNRELLKERERIATLQAQLANVKHEIEFQNKERERILKTVNSYQGRIDRLPLVEQQMAAVTRDYEISKANYKSLLDKKLSAGMATDMERRQKSERFMIIDPARVPEKPFSPNRPLLAAFGAALSLALSIVAGFALEFRKGALLGEWELPPEVAILGRVPYIEMTPHPRSSIGAAMGMSLGVAGILTAVAAAFLLRAWK